jgi:hypothetical protein
MRWLGHHFLVLPYSVFKLHWQCHLVGPGDFERNAARRTSLQSAFEISMMRSYDAYLCFR